MSILRYVDKSHFYVVSWKKGLQGTGRPGIQLKKVDSSTGPGSSLGQALFSSSPVDGQVS